MQLRDLINRLERMAEDMGDDAPVLVAIQPSWPLALELRGVAADEETEEEDEMDGYQQPTAERTVPPPAVWLVVSDSHPWNRSPYAEKNLWENCR